LIGIKRREGGREGGMNWIKMEEKDKGREGRTASGKQARVERAL